MRALFARGGREEGNAHYRLIVAMHVAFFGSAITEWLLRGELLPGYWTLPFLVFVAAQFLRWISRKALAGRWTARIVTVPGERLVANGPYKYLHHPIYIAVCLELASLPMIFGLWYTALAFTTLNAIVLLTIRIPAENRALSRP